MSPRPRPNLTVALCGLLHFLTHIYPMLLLPLYLLLQEDLELPHVWMATLLTTIHGLVYCVAHLPAGHWADKASRRTVLTAGLAVNAAAFIALASARTYWQAVAALVVGAAAGGAYHPAANALLVAQFPRRPGRIIGLVGIGAALAFFLAPIYAGWRGLLGSWRDPCREAGLLGLAVAALFWALATDAPANGEPAPGAATRTADRRRLALVVLGVMAAFAIVFGIRDFGGGGVQTLSSLYLQQAQGFTAKEAGLFLGLMSLPSVLANPVFGWLSDSRRRLSWLVGLLLVSGLSAALIPWAGLAGSGRSSLLLTALTIHRLLVLGSVPIVTAAIGTSVPDRLRGRAFGVFATGAGAIGTLEAVAMGRVSDALKHRVSDPSAFIAPFTLLGVLVALSSLGVPLIAWVRRYVNAAEPEAAAE